MNKRAILILAIITLFFGAAYVTTKTMETKKEDIKAEEIIGVRKEETKSQEEEIINTSTNEEKTTPNTILVLKKKYIDCGHTITDKAEIPGEMVNLTKDEIIKKYVNWNVDSFTKDEVILTKDMDSFCGEHYLVIEEEGRVLIYSLDEENNRTLMEETEIAFEYLPETDKTILKNGIYVFGKEELNKIKEDFE